MAVPSVQVCMPHVSAERVAQFLSGAESEPPLQTVYLGRNKAPDTVIQKLVRFVDYLGDVPPPPGSKSWVNAEAKKSIKNIYGNDSQGDCVIASYFHGVGVSSANESGAAILGTTQEALNEYHRVCGAGDNGCYIPDVKNAAITGLTIGGKKRKIVGFATVDPANKLAVQTAILISGSGFNIGFNVPAAWMGANAYDGAVWDVPSRFSFVGGHDIRAVGYDEVGVQFATWGFVVTITWAAMAEGRIVDEAYIEFQEDWDVVEPAPSGLNRAQLIAAIAAYNAGNVPDWNVEPPAPVPPVPPVPPIPPVPPVPPVPPAPPVPTAWPNYAGQFSFHLPLFGTMTGTVQVAPTQSGLDLLEAPLEMASVWTILIDGWAIVAAYTSGNGAELLNAINKLFADLGIALLPEHAKVGARTAKSAMLNPIQILGDIWAVWSAVKARDVAAIAMAVAKLLADLGIVI